MYFIAKARGLTTGGPSPFSFWGVGPSDFYMQEDNNYSPVNLSSYENGNVGNSQDFKKFNNYFRHLHNTSNRILTSNSRFYIPVMKVKYDVVQPNISTSISFSGKQRK